MYAYICTTLVKQYLYLYYYMKGLTLACVKTRKEAPVE